VQELTSVSVSANLPFVETYQDGIAAIGDPTRRAIFELLAKGPTPVGELAARLPVSRPAVSQHLRVLKAAGLVHDRAVGTRRLYQLDPTGVAGMRAYLDRFWDSALTDFKAAAEGARNDADQQSDRQSDRQTQQGPEEEPEPEPEQE
jgi:DNA-binding transcriptional ArsR family regulator